MTFVNAGMLLGLLAVAVPLLIHLMRSRHFQPAKLGTLRFLHESLRQRRRWNRLENLPLLAARIAIVILLALLFARPFRASDNMDVNQPSQVWVAMDVSGSMAATVFGDTKAAIAQQKLRRLLRSLPQGVRLTTVVFADQVRPWDPQKQPSPPIGGRTDYEALGRWLATQMRSTATSDSKTGARRPNRRVYLFTDLQESGLPAAAWEGLPADVPIEIVATGSSDDWNAAIQQGITAGETFSPQSLLDADVRVFSSTPDSVEGEPIDIEVAIEGTEIHRQRIACRSNHLTIPWRPPGPGTYTGHIQILTEDGLTTDNVSPFVVQLRRPVDVLLVNGQPGATRFGDETYFLQAALTTTEREGVASKFRVTKREKIGDIQGCAVIALCNVRYLPATEVAQLKRFVQDGGSLIFFLGDQVSEATYQPMIQAGIFPAHVVSKEVHTPARLVHWTTDHALLTAFRGDSLDGLRRLVFRDSLRLDPTMNTTTLAAFTNREPAIIEQKMGDGRIVVFGNPVDRDWQDLPLQRSFVPLIRELFTLLGDRTAQRRAVRRRVQGIDETRPVGIYKNTDQYEVVTADPLESSLIGTSESEFRRRLGLPPSSDDARLGIDESGLPEKRVRPNEFWRHIAVMLLIVLAVENWLADRR